MQSCMSDGPGLRQGDRTLAIVGHPEVLEAAVIAIPDEKWDERPLVAVVLHRDSTTTPAALQRYLADKVAKWQLPENWALLREVPKTSVGKFDKKRLRADYARRTRHHTHCESTQNRRDTVLRYRIPA